MSTFIAKPVIDKQFWILQKDNVKVGNVEACAGGYQIKIENQVVAQYKTIKMVERKADIQFEDSCHPAKTKISNVHGYPTSGRVHNPVWDVTKKLPMYTKSKKSRSWHAAGWYNIKQGRKWKVTQDPKVILLQRYQFTGPFYSRAEAEIKKEKIV